MELLEKYFSEFTPKQREQFDKLKALYEEWNAQINVISRKDMDNFYERHVLHALALVPVMEFKDGAEILDVGTGGGFPGIPLAIFYPNVHFTLVDSIGKKIKVVQEVSDALGLTNVTAIHGRAEKVKGKFDFVVSRAVTRMNNFVPWVRNQIKTKQIHALPNGILYLKGGDLKAELNEAKVDYDLFPISDFFEEEFFDTKYVVYVKLT